MIRRRISAWLCGAAMFVVLGTAAQAADDPMAQLRIARTPSAAATPFDLTGLDGRRVQLRDLAGKVVLINFWATWCGPCKEEMPAFERLRRQLDPERVVLMTITTDLQRDGITHFLQGLDVHLPVLFDEDREVSQAYFVRALPTSVIIDPRGVLVGRAVGPREWDSPQTVHWLRTLAQERP